MGDGIDDVLLDLGGRRWDKQWWDAHIHSITDTNGRHVVPTTPGACGQDLL
jgi:hypothetical protein